MSYIISKDYLKLQRENSSFLIGFGGIKGDLLALKNQQALLHKLELQKFNEFKFDKRKHSYLLGRASAKHAISTLRKEEILAELMVGEGIFNFPVVKNLKGDHLQLSISHCDDIGITLAYPEEHPVGIDIERVNEKSVDALKSVVNLSEQQLLSKLPISEIEGLGIIWTVKEALSKIFRTGMMMDFGNFEVSKITYNGQFYMSEYKNAAQYKAISIFNSPYVTSITIPGRSELDTDQLIDLLSLTISKES